ncbi:MAG: helix-turn-helix domain-containing protein [Bacteroidaceae bacterium]|nr:helix-turn-helix domain-containing protein [Bacteroidaceae bacterium]
MYTTKDKKISIVKYALIICITSFIFSCNTNNNTDKKNLLKELCDSAQLYADKQLYYNSSRCCAEGVSLARELNDSSALGFMEYRVGQNLFIAENYDAATMHFQHAINYLDRHSTQSIGSDTLNKVLMAQNRIALGILKFKIMDYEDAYNQFDTAQVYLHFVRRTNPLMMKDNKVDSLLGTSYIFIARSLLGMNKRAKSEEYINDFKTYRYSKTFEGRLYYGCYFLDEENFDKALEVFDEIEANGYSQLSEKNRMEYHYRKRMCYQFVGKYQDACDQWTLYERNRHYFRKYFTNIQLVYQCNEFEKQQLLDRDGKKTSDLTFYRTTTHIALVVFIGLISFIVYLYTQLRKHVVYTTTNDRSASENVRQIDSGKEKSAINLNVEEEELERRKAVEMFIDELTAKKLYCDPYFRRDSLLEQLHIRKVTFSYDFETVTGDTFTNYLKRIRLEHAAELLREEPDRTIDSIALDSGFSGRSTFYRLFSEQYGVSPSEYKLQYQK